MLIPFAPVPPPEIQSARRALVYLDLYIRPALTDDLRRRYLWARHSQAWPVKTTRARLLFIGPTIPCPATPLSGDGDTVYGPARLEALIDDVVCRMIETNTLPPAQVREITQRIEDDFPQLVEKMDSAETRRGRGSPPAGMSPYPPAQKRPVF